MNKKMKLTQNFTSILMYNNTNIYRIKNEIIIKKQ